MEEHTLTKIEIITRPSKLEELKEALNKIGVMGMTVSQVFGCGLQKATSKSIAASDTTSICCRASR